MASVNFFCNNHQNKASRLIHALERHRYRLVSLKRKHIRFALIDHCIGKEGAFSDYVIEIGRRGIPLFQYPHSARPTIQQDFYDPHPSWLCSFATSEAGAEIMRLAGWKKPIEVVGWHLSKIFPFCPTGRLKKVLFAPIHPNNNGWLAPFDKEENAKTFEILTSLPINLVVRWLKPFENNGIHIRSDVHYIEGRPGQGLGDLAGVDLVVSAQTFAYMAVARGIPTVMISETIRPHTGNSDETLVWAKNWEKYKDRMTFPYNLTTTSNPLEMMKEACRTDENILEWKNRLIGKPFDPRHFVERLRTYLQKEKDHV